MRLYSSSFLTNLLQFPHDFSGFSVSCKLLRMLKTSERLNTAKSSVTMSSIDKSSLEFLIRSKKRDNFYTLTQKHFIFTLHLSRLSVKSGKNVQNKTYIFLNVQIVGTLCRRRRNEMVQASHGSGVNSTIGIMKKITCYKKFNILNLSVRTTSTRNRRSISVFNLDQSTSSKTAVFSWTSMRYLNHRNTKK